MAPHGTFPLCLGVGSLELGVATTLEEGQEGGGWSSVWEELEQNQQVSFRPALPRIINLKKCGIPRFVL